MNKGRPENRPLLIVYKYSHFYIETEGVWGSSRPENCPVDSFQQRAGGSPGRSESPLCFFLSFETEGV